MEKLYKLSMNHCDIHAQQRTKYTVSHIWCCLKRRRIIRQHLVAVIRFVLTVVELDNLMNSLQRLLFVMKVASSNYLSHRKSGNLWCPDMEFLYRAVVMVCTCLLSGSDHQT